MNLCSYCKRPIRFWQRKDLSLTHIHPPAAQNSNLPSIIGFGVSNYTLVYSFAHSRCARAIRYEDINHELRSARLLVQHYDAQRNPEIQILLMNLLPAALASLEGEKETIQQEYEVFQKLLEETRKDYLVRKLSGADK